MEKMKMQQGIDEVIIDLNQRLDKIAPILGLESEDLISTDRPDVSGLSPRLIFGKDTFSCGESAILLLQLEVELMEAAAQEESGQANRKAAAARMLLEENMACLCRRCIQLSWLATQDEDVVHLEVPEKYLWQVAREDQDGHAKEFGYNYRDYFRLARLVRTAEIRKQERKYGTTELSKFYNRRPVTIESQPA